MQSDVTGARRVGLAAFMGGLAKAAHGNSNDAANHENNFILIFPAASETTTCSATIRAWSPFRLLCQRAVNIARLRRDPTSSRSCSGADEVALQDRHIRIAAQARAVRHFDLSVLCHDPFAKRAC